MANAMRLPETASDTPESVNEVRNKPLSPALTLTAGIVLTLAAAGWSWLEFQTASPGPSEVYFGPAIGDVSNPYIGKLVTDGANTVRVDASDDGKSIIVQAIKTDEDRQKWLSEQRDRPPEPVTVAQDPNYSLRETVLMASTTFTSAMDSHARAKFRLQHTFHDKAVATKWLRSGGFSVVALGVLGIGIYEFARTRRR